MPTFEKITWANGSKMGSYVLKASVGQVSVDMSVKCQSIYRLICQPRVSRVSVHMLFKFIDRWLPLSVHSQSVRQLTISQHLDHYSAT